MRRALLLLAVAGCASAPKPGDESPARQAPIFQSRETGTILGERPSAVTMAVAAAPATVWLAAKKVYADLEIPLSVDNPAAHQLGNQNFYKSRQFGGQPMTQFVDCGSGMTGANAASYRIYMSLLTTVTPDGKGGTTVNTTFVPAGQDVMGGSSDRIPCGSTGRLEGLLLNRIKAAAGGL